SSSSCWSRVISPPSYPSVLTAATPSGRVRIVAHLYALHIRHQVEGNTASRRIGFSKSVLHDREADHHATISVSRQNHRRELAQLAGNPGQGDGLLAILEFAYRVVQDEDRRLGADAHRLQLAHDAPQAGELLVVERDVRQVVQHQQL